LQPQQHEVQLAKMQGRLFVERARTIALAHAAAK
jgi:hypothetical protein